MIHSRLHESIHRKAVQILQQLADATKFSSSLLQLWLVVWKRWQHTAWRPTSTNHDCAQEDEDDCEASSDCTDTTIRLRPVAQANWQREDRCSVVVQPWVIGRQHDCSNDDDSWWYNNNSDNNNRSWSGWEWRWRVERSSRKEGEQVNSIFGWLVCVFQPMIMKLLFNWPSNRFSLLSSPPKRTAANYQPPVTLSSTSLLYKLIFAVEHLLVVRFTPFLPSTSHTVQFIINTLKFTDSWESSIQQSKARIILIHLSFVRDFEPMTHLEILHKVSLLAVFFLAFDELKQTIDDFTYARHVGFAAAVALAQL